MCVCLCVSSHNCLSALDGISNLFPEVRKARRELVSVKERLLRMNGVRTLYRCRECLSALPNQNHKCCNK